MYFQRDGAVQVTLKVKIAPEIGIRQTDRVSVQYQPAQHGGVAHHHREGGGFPCGRVQRVVPQAQRCRACVAAHETVKNANGGRRRRH